MIKPALAVAISVIAVSLAGCASVGDYPSAASNDKCTYSAVSKSVTPDSGIAVIYAPTSNFTDIDQLTSAVRAGVTSTVGKKTNITTLVASSKSEIVSNATVDLSGSVFGDNARNEIQSALAAGASSAKCYISLKLMEPELDLLSSIRQAAGAIAPAGQSKEIFIVSNGLQTTGDFSLVSSFQLSASDISRSLVAAKSLPDLTGYKLHFLGLGLTSGEQPVFSSASAQHLQEIWSSIAEGFGASADFDSRISLAGGNPGAPKVALVAPLRVPPIVASCKAVLTDENLTFESNSSKFINPDAADASVRDLTQQLKIQKCNGQLKVSGFTTNYSSETAQKALAQLRAQAVSDLISKYYVADSKFVVGVGYDGTGDLDPSNRRVEVEVAFQ